MKNGFVIAVLSAVIFIDTANAQATAGTSVRNYTPKPPVLAVDQSFAMASPEIKTVIIVDDNQLKQGQADYDGPQALRGMIYAVTGRDTPIIKQSDYEKQKEKTPYDCRIWVGEQPKIREVVGEEIAKLDGDGFLIRSIGTDVYICGKGPWGTRYAVFDLMERFAGYRCYAPPEPPQPGLFHVIPKSKEIRLPKELNIVENPAYKMRWMRHVPYYAMRMRYRDKFHHNFTAILPTKEYGKTHPEYFSLWKGKRFVPDNAAESQPCLGNPDVQRITLEAAVKFFQENPDLNCFSVGLNDSGAFCQCELCLALIPPEVKEKLPSELARIAYMTFAFYNRIATELEKVMPDKRLGCLAYAATQQLPEGLIRLHPMIVPYVTRDSAQLFDKNKAEDFRNTMAKWSRMSSRMGIYEYFYGSGFVVPRIYSRYLLKNIQERYGANVDGFYAEDYCNWGLDGIKYWLAAKMLWDKRLDPERLKEQYCADLFGPAAKTMKEYFDFLEDCWCTQEQEGVVSNKTNYRWLYDQRQLAIFPPAKTEKAWKMLEQAEQEIKQHRESLDAGDKDEILTAEAMSNRLQVYKTCFSLSRAFCRRYAGQNAFAPFEKEVRGREITVAEALPRLETGLNLPSTQEPYNQLLALSQKSGLGLPAPLFCDAVAPSVLEHYGDPGSIIRILNRVVDLSIRNAIAAAKDDQSQKTILSQLEKLAAENARIATTASAQETLIKINTIASERGVLFARPTSIAPVLDGKISQDEWGEPAFHGRFFYLFSLDTTPQETSVWLLNKDNMLYVAFYCWANEKLAGGDVKGRDTDPLNPYRKMWKDDSVCLNLLTTKSALPPIGVIEQYATVILNIEGAFHDESPGGGNSQVLDFAEGKATRTERGWKAEIAIDLTKLGLLDRQKSLFLCLSHNYRESSFNMYGQQIVRTRSTSLLPLTGPGEVVPKCGYANTLPAMTFITGARLMLPMPEPSNQKVSK